MAQGGSRGDGERRSESGNALKAAPPPPGVLSGWQGGGKGCTYAGAWAGPAAAHMCACSGRQENGSCLPGGLCDDGAPPRLCWVRLT